MSEKADDYLLRSVEAKKLYREVCALPIFDYHCHLSPKEIYEDRVFKNIGELWLEADHYKWRLMRIAGVDERYITGSATYKEKFFKFAEILPDFVGNPVYHWAHLELRRYFGMDVVISFKTAEYIWEETLRLMADGSFSAKRLIRSSNVHTLITTDDIISDLKYHKLLKGECFTVLPSFRLDNLLGVERDGFSNYIGTLSDVSGVEIYDLKSLTRAIEDRLDYFMSLGMVSTDVSFENFPKSDGNQALAESCLKNALAGKPTSDEEREEYKFFILASAMRLVRERGGAFLMHSGVIRNVNKKRFDELGADSGIDSIGEPVDVKAAARLFNFVNEEGLPKTEVFTLSAPSYYQLATLLQDFAGETRGRLQLGAAWWFMDSRDGIEEQLKIYANTSGIGNFNGMLTDSRSFTSYARHDYFRRVLCSLLGEWVKGGECDFESALYAAKNICYYNAESYFGRKK